ncbi:peptidase M23 [bacterium (candidate division B38) B3_B38]|nr:MAG: peptidase M23 [bacterium (candidate division B38) B3_B38]
MLNFVFIAILSVVQLSALGGFHPVLPAVSEPSLQQASPLIELQARSLQPGEAVLIRVKGWEMMAEVRGRFLHQELSFFSQAGVWSALGGIGLATSPGVYQLEIEGTLPDGTLLKEVKDFTIEKKVFPLQRLKVDPRFIVLSPEDQRRVAEEQEIIRKIWGSPQPIRLWRGRFLAPIPDVEGRGFGSYRVFNNQRRSQHTGVDLSAPEGTPLIACNRGMVVLARELFFGGNTIFIDHGEGLYSMYFHLSEILVKKGEMVIRGETIGLVGATGRVTGPHLHCSIRLQGTRLDPFSLFSLPLEER